MLVLFFVRSLSDLGSSTEPNHSSGNPAHPDDEKTLAEQYYQHFDELTTKGQKFQALAWSLTELAALVDSAATRYEIEFEIGGHLHSVLNKVDSRDHDMKKQFQELKKQVSNFQVDIDKLINQTRNEVQLSMKAVRKEITHHLRDLVTKKLRESKSAQKFVQNKVDSSMSSIQKSNSKQTILYFLGFQVLLVACIYLYYKYMQQMGPV